ncbi:unnamed protein product [Effrenium voratum]|uniref:Uncharacterized protein n=1 Tax=Effrenium voratum TaxID=2562239 RepID=A0AA36JB25_9DINO|nr:unnamed protein product [Effrenium voratum]
MGANSCVLFAPDCSSWGIPARGTSLRSEINFGGNRALKWIQGANKMVSRMTLCILLALSRNMIYIIEQPAYPRQFGASLLQAFQRHIDGPARRDLRFKVRDSATSAMDLFEGLPLGDLWEEADLLPAFLYAYSSKKLRQVCRVWQSMFCDILRRMPRECVPIMAKFKREFQEQAFGWLHSRA